MRKTPVQLAVFLFSLVCAFHVRGAFWGGGGGGRKKDGFGSLIYVQWRSWRWMGFRGGGGVFGFCTGKMRCRARPIHSFVPSNLYPSSILPIHRLSSPPQPTQSTSCTHASYLISHPRKIKPGHLHTPRKTPQHLLYLGTGQSNLK